MTPPGSPTVEALAPGGLGKSCGALTCLRAEGKLVTLQLRFRTSSALAGSAASAIRAGHPWQA